MQKKKLTCTKQIFINLLFQRILGACVRRNWPNFDAPLSSLKRFLGCRYFGLKLVTFSQLFSQGLCNRCCKPSFLRVRPNIYPAVENNAWFFFKKVFLKGTSPVDHGLRKHKKPCYKSLSIFTFRCLTIYTPITPIDTMHEWLPI